MSNEYWERAFGMNDTQNRCGDSGPETRKEDGSDGLDVAEKLAAWLNDRHEVHQNRFNASTNAIEKQRIDDRIRECNAVRCELSRLCMEKR